MTEHQVSALVRSSIRMGAMLVVVGLVIGATSMVIMGIVAEGLIRG